MSGRAAVHVVERRFELHQIFGLTPIMVRRWPE